MTEKLNFIMIETPMRGELLKDISFEDAHQKINEDLKRMYDSNFYESINIHYGVISTQTENVYK
jgi:hypothetical protein